MKKLSCNGNTCYDVLLDDNILLSRRKTACFRELFNFSGKYNIIRIYNIECEQTIDYKDFFINYIIKMFNLKNTNLTNEYFEFKSTGYKYKDLIVMTITRLLWEYICGNSDINNVEVLFKPLKEGKSKYKNKLKRFCDFYSRIIVNYKNDGHCPHPHLMIIKSTKDFEEITSLKSVNEFFYK